MNKFLCSIVFVLSFFSVHAHAQDLQEEMKKLVERVDSLEHALSYQKLVYDLSMLQSDINIMSNSVNSKCIDIQLKLYTRNLNSVLYDVYVELYNACQFNKNALFERFETQKNHLLLVVATYSEKEQNVLLTGYNAINSSKTLLERSMEMFKFLIDSYKEEL